MFNTPDKPFNIQNQYINSKPPTSDVGGWMDHISKQLGPNTATPFFPTGGGKGNTGSSVFFYPASYFSQPEQPQMKANTAATLGFTGFNTRLSQTSFGTVQSMQGYNGGGDATTLKPTLLPGY